MNRLEKGERLISWKLILLPCLAFLISVAPNVAEAQERSIHVFTVFCDAYEGQAGLINEGVTADKVIIDGVFREYFSEQAWGVTLRRDTVEGLAATAAEIEKRFADFVSVVGPEDTVYVHFSGHGVIKDRDVGEQFLQTVDETEISRQTWADQIEALPCRLKIFITDCCSTYPPEFTIAEGDAIVEPWRNLYSLLLEHEGFVNITAASPGQPAYGTEYGGFLTINLESDIQRFRSWEKVFASTQERVFEETKAEIQRAGNPSMSPQRPFAYSLGRPVFGADEPPVQYVLPDSDSRELTRAELERLGLQQLYLARNEIFARYGYDFSSPFLQQYFGAQRWYQRQPGFKSPPTTALENANAALILAVERDLGGPFIAGKRLLPGEESDTETLPDIFAYSSDRTLSRSVLQNLSPQELSIARNEIFARHGYPFQSQALQRYFARKPGYSRNPSASSPAFNAVESHNLWLIRKVERINGGAYRW